MYKNILQSMEGVTIWPLISLLIFVIFFVLLLIWVFRADKKYIERMKNLPLAADETKNLIADEASFK
jgi:cytochrome c oxidase cbb3-type subunit IV